MNEKSFFNKLTNLLTLRREWFPRLFRGLLLFYFTRFYRFLIPWTKNIKIGKNVRIQWPLALLAELPKSSITVGDHAIIYENAMIESYGEGHISIGAHSVIGDNCIYSRGKILIGERVVTSWNVMIQDFDPHPIDPDLRARQIKDLALQFHPHFDGFYGAVKDQINFDFSPGEIVIGDDVWLGAGCFILKGAHIGEGSIVAAGAVVTKGEYPKRSILAGNPAKIVKML